MLRPILLTVIFFCSAFTLQAQVFKGQFLLGGQFLVAGTRGETDNTQDQKADDFSFRPQIGYAFRDNRVVGLSLLYGQDKDAFTFMPYKAYKTGGGLFYRAYLTLPKGFFVFGQAEVNYQYTKEENDLGQGRQVTQTFNEYGASLYPGVGYAVKKRFHLELSVNDLVTFTYRTKRKVDTGPNGTSEQTTRTWLLRSDLFPQRGLVFAFRFLLGGDSR